MRAPWLLGLIVTLMIASNPRADSSPVGSYRVIKSYSVPGDGRWDYISLDSGARRLYVSHGEELDVLDADSGEAVGRISGTPGVHGAAIVSEFHRGFISEGGDQTVTIFDTATLDSVKRVHVDGGTDFILYDPFSKRVFAFHQKTTVLDGRSGDIVGVLDVGGDTEAAVANGSGLVYVNLADKAAIAVIDSQTLAVVRKFNLAGCTSPHSLAYDSAHDRLFVGCRDGFVAINTGTGKVVGRSILCSGVDSGGFDSESGLVFESCSEGVISVIRQVTPDYYVLVDTVPTKLWARTMAFDPKTKNIYLPAADFNYEPNTDPKFPLPFREVVRPGSFKVLVVAKQ